MGRGTTFHFTMRLGVQNRSGNEARGSRAGQPARPARAGGGRQRHQPAHPGGDADQLAHEANGGRQRPRGAGGDEAARPPRANRSPWCLRMPSCRRWTALAWPSRSSNTPELAKATLLMLSSADHQTDMARCRAVGISRLPDQARQAVGAAERHCDRPERAGGQTKGAQSRPLVARGRETGAVAAPTAAC